MVKGEEIVFDYHVLDIVIIILLCLVWGLLNRMNPKRMHVPKRDSRLMYPHYDSGITEAMNLVVVIGLPVIVYIIMFAILKTKGTLYAMVPFDFIAIVVGHVGCIILANILANVIKLQVGRPRPDFFSVLGLNATSETQIPDSMSYKTYYECFKSFPSGHSASASCGGFFFLLFLQKAIKTNQFSIYMLKMLPIGYTFYVACTRIIQYRHHFEDVLGGLMIGFIFPSLYFYGQQEVIFTSKPFP